VIAKERIKFARCQSQYPVARGRKKLISAVNAALTVTRSVKANAQTIVNEKAASNHVDQTAFRLRLHLPNGVESILKLGKYPRCSKKRTTTLITRRPCSWLVGIFNRRLDDFCAILPTNPWICPTISPLLLPKYRTASQYNGAREHCVIRQCCRQPRRLIFIPFCKCLFEQIQDCLYIHVSLLGAGCLYPPLNWY